MYEKNQNEAFSRHFFSRFIFSRPRLHVVRAGTMKEREEKVAPRPLDIYF
jgi:hypothetical protein